MLLYPTIHYALAPEAATSPCWRGRAMGWSCLAGALQVATLQVATIAPMAWAIALAAATTGVLTVVNALLIILALNREGTAQRWSSVALYGVAGLGAALAETGTLALVRRLVVG